MLRKRKRVSSDAGGRPTEICICAVLHKPDPTKYCSSCLEKNVEKRKIKERLKRKAAGGYEILFEESEEEQIQDDFEREPVGQIGIPNTAVDLAVLAPGMKSYVFFFKTELTKMAHVMIDVARRKRNLSDIYKYVLVERWDNFNALRIIEDHEMIVDIRYEQHRVKEGRFQFMVKVEHERYNFIQEKMTYFIDSTEIWLMDEQKLFKKPKYIHLRDEFYTRDAKMVSTDDLRVKFSINPAYGSHIWVGEKIKDVDKPIRGPQQLRWVEKYLCLKDRHLFFVKDFDKLVYIYCMKKEMFRSYWEEDDKLPEKDKKLQMIAPIRDIEIYMLENPERDYAAPSAAGFLIRNLKSHQEEPLELGEGVTLCCVGQENFKDDKERALLRRMWVIALRLAKHGNNIKKNFLKFTFLQGETLEVAYKKTTAEDPPTDDSYSPPDVMPTPEVQEALEAYTQTGEGQAYMMLSGERVYEKEYGMAKEGVDPRNIPISPPHSREPVAGPSGLQAQAGPSGLRTSPRIPQASASSRVFKTSPRTPQASTAPRLLTTSPRTPQASADRSGLKTLPITPQAIAGLFEIKKSPKSPQAQSGPNQSKKSSRAPQAEAGPSGLKTWPVTPEAEAGPSGSKTLPVTPEAEEPVPGTSGFMPSSPLGEYQRVYRGSKTPSYEALYRQLEAPELFYRDRLRNAEEADYYMPEEEIKKKKRPFSKVKKTVVGGFNKLVGKSTEYQSMNTPTPTSAQEPSTPPHNEFQRLTISPRRIKFNLYSLFGDASKSLAKYFVKQLNSPPPPVTEAVTRSDGDPILHEFSDPPDGEFCHEPSFVPTSPDGPDVRVEPEEPIQVGPTDASTSTSYGDQAETLPIDSPRTSSTAPVLIVPKTDDDTDVDSQEAFGDMQLSPRDKYRERQKRKLSISMQTRRSLDSSFEQQSAAKAKLTRLDSTCVSPPPQLTDAPGPSGLGRQHEPQGSSSESASLSISAYAKGISISSDEQPSGTSSSQPGNESCDNSSIMVTQSPAYTRYQAMRDSAALTRSMHSSIDHEDANNPRVPMDFTHGEGRVVVDPAEIEEIRSVGRRSGSRFPQIPNPPAEALRFGPHLTQNYYHGLLDRADAEAMVLKQNQNGVFLLRDSKNRPGNLVITYAYNQKAHHLYIHPVISQSSSGQIYLATYDHNTVFFDVHSLIEHHRLNHGGLPTLLSSPVRNSTQPDATPLRNRTRARSQCQSPRPSETHGTALVRNDPISSTSSEEDARAPARRPSRT